MKIKLLSKIENISLKEKKTKQKWDPLIHPVFFPFPFFFEPFFLKKKRKTKPLLNPYW